MSEIGIGPKKGLEKKPWWSTGLIYPLWSAEDCEFKPLLEPLSIPKLMREITRRFEIDHEFYGEGKHREDIWIAC